MTFREGPASIGPGGFTGEAMIRVRVPAPPATAHSTPPVIHRKDVVKRRSYFRGDNSVVYNAIRIKSRLCQDTLSRHPLEDYRGTGF